MGKSRPDVRVRSWFDEAGDDLYLSVLVLGELKHGVERLRRRDALQAARLHSWMARVEERFSDRILDVDVPIAHAWGRINAIDFVPAIDGLLAATALVHGLTVVTRDTEPFERVGVPWLDPWSA